MWWCLGVVWWRVALRRRCVACQPPSARIALLQLFGRKAASSGLSGDVDVRHLTRAWMIHPNSLFRRAWNLTTVRAVALCNAFLHLPRSQGHHLRRLVTEGLLCVCVVLRREPVLCFAQIFLVVTLLFWIPFDLGFNFEATLDGTPSQQFWWVLDLVMVRDRATNTAKTFLCHLYLRNHPSACVR